MKFVSNYKDNQTLRESFMQLALQVFGIDFKPWYEKGCWNDRYIPYSYTDGDKIVANVSINIMDLILDGERRKALQIGTVMTHPEYRNNGLSKKLMNLVLEQYETEYEIIYLMANKDVLDFYPKFGFKPVRETQFTIKCCIQNPSIAGVRKLDPESEEDFKIIERLVLQRSSISKVLGVENCEAIQLFYALVGIPDCYYYVKEADVILVYHEENGIIHLYDIISKEKIDFHRLISKIPAENVRQIIFEFTPDLLEINTSTSPLDSEDTFFVRSSLSFDNKEFKYPKTAMA
ncbi:MAG: GNAT family N-acetyltransferase [Clostridia bacterium]|nr:GNAT family N-acetyltransferase [Clostridia bacterium]